jgi:phytoene dehydrogenase-like protein
VPTGSKQGKYDAVVIGGGHNGLVAATYLAKAGMSVLVLERLDETGGAATNADIFTGLPARISRYANLVSAFPDRVIDELGLDIQFRSRRTASYSPAVRGGINTGLIVERHEGDMTRQSFRDLTGSDREYDAWRSFYAEIADFAKEVAPTLMEPLVAPTEIYDRVKRETWEMLVEHPIGAGIEQRFSDDLVRGVVASDAVTMSFADVNDYERAANKTFLYHLIGNGTGEWRVPVGGVGALSASLERAAWRNGVEIVTRAFVNKVESDGTAAAVTWQAGGETHTVETSWVVSGVAPWVMQILLGEQPGPRPEGALVKVNMLLERLPRLRSGASPAQAFAGSFHIGQSYSQLHTAYAEASAGNVPTVVPGVMQCPTLTDPSVLGPLAIEGMHAFSFVGHHTPARLFSGNVEQVRDDVVVRILDGINLYLDEPIEALLALDANGVPCLEAQAPQDIESSLAMPGGHPFHGDLEWPWAKPNSPMDTPALRWGVNTDVANVVLCSAGAQRGGAVSGIGGHNAAMAVLDTRDGRL